MKKILEIVTTMSLGGVEKLVSDLIHIADKEKYGFDILCTQAKTGELLDDVANLGVPVHYYGDYRQKPIYVFWKFYHLLKSEKYDVVHIHLNYWSAYYLIIARLAGNSKCVVHYHNVFKSNKKNPIKFFFYFIHKKTIDLLAFNIIGISDACLNSVYKTHWEENSKVTRVYNGINLEEFSLLKKKHLIKDKFNINSTTTIIGHVGRFRKQKNHTFLLNITKKLLVAGYDIVLVLIGNGPTMPEVQKKATELGIEKNVIFYGTSLNIPGLLSSMDIFLFPSIYEGFGLALIEAQASGLPIIASDAIPLEIPLPYPSKRLPLENQGDWVDACKDLITLTQSSGYRRSIPKEIGKFSIYNWVTSICSIYEK